MTRKRRMRREAWVGVEEAKNRGVWTEEACVGVLVMRDREVLKEEASKEEVAARQNRVGALEMKITLTEKDARIHGKKLITRIQNRQWTKVKPYKTLFLKKR